MTWLFAILGFVVGAALFRQPEEALLVAGLGFLVGSWLGLQSRVSRLEQETAELRRLVRAAQSAHPQEPPVAEVPATAARTPSADLPEEPLSLDPDFLAEIATPPPQTAVRRPLPPAAGGWQERSRHRQPPPPQPESWEPSALDRLIGGIKDWFTQGNPFVRIGVVLLFFGVAFLLKYAADHSVFPIELRLAGVAAGGIALLLTGWRLRGRQRAYALVLQGAGVGVLYLVTFAAFQLYHLLPPGFAFAVLILMTALAVMLAVIQDAVSLAVLGVSGGFLAPVLISTGQGDHVALFSYYLLLNLGIFAVAWRRAWRFLNLLGFFFTFAIGTAWGVLQYKPEQFGTTEPFLVAFFLLYLAIAVLFALRQPPNLRGYIDGTLVFGNPLLAFGLQVALVHEYEYGVAYSALAFGTIYLGLARLLWDRFGEELRPLLEGFLALGVIFASLAIPFGLSGHWSAAAWALEGAGILWVGVRQQRVSARLFGVLLQFGAGVLYLWEPGPYGTLLFINGAFIGVALIAFAGFFSGWLLERNRDQLGEGELLAGRALLIWGLLWWYLGALAQFNRHLDLADEALALPLFAAATSIAFALAWRRWSWAGAFWSAQLLLPAMLLTMLALLDRHYHPGSGIGLVGWPVAWAAFYGLLRYFDEYPPEQGAQRDALKLLHTLGLPVVAGLLIWEGDWQLYDSAERATAFAWEPALLGFVPLLLLGLILKAELWPVARHPLPYRAHAGAAFALYLAFWSLFANLAANGSAPPLPYLPLLNPLDLVQVAALLLIARWFLAARRIVPQWEPFGTHLWRLLGLLAFVLLTAVLLRTLHQWADIPYRFEPMMRSFLVQASLSIFWTVLGTAVMVTATRLGRRPLWIAGASLVGLVVVKLFLVDLAASGTLERIVSFVAVGLLLMLVGWFSPLPPRSEEESR